MDKSETSMDQEVYHSDKSHEFLQSTQSTLGNTPSRTESVTTRKEDESSTDFTSELSESRPKSSGNESPEEKEVSKSFSLLHTVAFVSQICISQIMSLAGVMMVLAPLHIIGDSFGVKDPGQLSWFIAAFSLAVGTFILPAGRLGDMYGHKKIYMIGWAWYSVWSLVAGLSVFSGPILFSIARGFQGIGPALIVPNALAIVGRTYPMGKKRNMVFSLFGACAPIGGTFGAVFSSIFSQLAWWPWSFWVMSIICMVLFFTSYFILPADRIIDDKDGPRPTFDYAGCLTGVGGLVMINFAWNQAGVVGWSTPYNYILLIAGLILMLIFLYIELHVATHPLIPLKNLNRESGFVVACIGVSWASFGIWIFYSFQFFQLLRHSTPLASAAQSSPVAISGAMASLATGFLISKLGVSRCMFISMLAFLTGQILIATAPIHQTYWAQTFLSFVIMPWGMDISFPAASIILSNSLPREHQGIAASLVNTVVNYSISMGLGVAGTITMNVSPHGTNLLGGYRAAWHFAIGLDAVGVLIGAYFLWSSRSK